MVRSKRVPSMGFDDSWGKRESVSWFYKEPSSALFLVKKQTKQTCENCTLDSS